MSVRQLFSKQDTAALEARETASVLRVLAGMAERGEILGVAMCYRERGGSDQAVFTGRYMAHPGEAVNAAMRLSWDLTKAQDALIGPP